MDRASPNIPHPEAVFLDIDDTVYDYTVAHREAVRATAAKSSSLLGLQPEAFAAAYDRARAAVQQRLGASASAHSRLLYFHSLIESVGMKSQPLLALDLEQTYWRTFLGAMKLFPGVVEFLEELRHQQIPVVAVTDLTTQIQLRKLVYLGLDTLLDYVVTSEEAGADKPDPAPFHLALSKVCKPAGHTIWMIGDSIERDARGAKAALGATTLMRRHTRLGNRASVVDLVFDTFSELEQLLRRSAEQPRVAQAG